MVAVIARFSPKVPCSSGQPIEILMPPKAFLDTIPDGAPRGCTFILRDSEHALRHALSILTIIRGAVIQEPYSQASVSYSHNAVWLLDTLQPLGSILVNWPRPLGVRLASLLQASIDMAESYSNSHRADSLLYHKASATLVLICAEFLQYTQPLLAEDDDGVSVRRTLCLALIHLANASASHAPTSRLVTSGLLPLAQRLVSENPTVGLDSDVGVRLTSESIIFLLILS
jgi:serine/threonine-protein kinase ATR